MINFYEQTHGVLEMVDTCNISYLLFKVGGFSQKSFKIFKIRMVVKNVINKNRLGYSAFFIKFIFLVIIPLMKSLFVLSAGKYLLVIYFDSL